VPDVVAIGARVGGEDLIESGEQVFDAPCLRLGLVDETGRSYAEGFG
jgi:hypothetical protein